MLSNSRYACLLVPNFALAIKLRHDPTLLLEQAALAEHERENALILEANGKAGRFGVRPGITAAQAHTLCPGLRVLVRDEQQEIKQAEQLLELLQNVTPLVEPEAPGVFIMEASGTERLYGGEIELAKKLIETFRKENYPAQIGIGGGRFVARVAASNAARNHYLIVPSEQTSEFLAEQSIMHLNLEDETEQRLLQLGLRTLGQVAAFPANELQSRFGEEGLIAARCSRGYDPDHFLPELLSDQLSAAQYYTTPLYRFTTVLEQVRLLLEGLLEQLEIRSESCRSLALYLGFDGGEEKWLTLTVAQPTSRAATLLRQLQMQFEKQRFAAPVAEIKIVISETASQQFNQLDLVSGKSNPITVDKLRTLSDTPPLCQVMTNSACLPEKSFALQPVTAKQSRSTATEQRERVSPFPHEVGLRLFPTPEDAEISDNNGLPRLMRCQGRKVEIGRVNGPWKVSGNWWNRTFYRHYYEVETKTRQRYLLFFDSICSRWFVQGVFD